MTGRLLPALALLAGCRAETPVPAFPGAEGAGMWATGGRGGAVYRVTNVNADGPGSLADAVSRPNRFIVFTVSGAIDLGGGKPGGHGQIRIVHPNITIAGQTAPGEGITIKNGDLHVAAGNVIIRHLRVRRGFIRKGNMGDAFTVKGDFENVILDHVSASWATDENLTLTNANNVTAQYALVTEALDYFNPPQTPPRHAFGSLFGSAFDDGRMTIHHSLYAHNRLRNARTTAGGRIPPVLDFRNNVVYDAKEATSHTGSQAIQANWVGNCYKDGPSTGVEGRAEEVSKIIFAFHSAEQHRLYLAGNYVFGSPGRTRDNWKGVSWGRKGKPLVTMAGVRVDRPFPAPPVTTQPALEAYETVLAEAGAILPSRDAVDVRIVNDVRDGTGAVINRETDIPEPGRWQVYHALPAPADADGDGMPDYWEHQFKLNPRDASDAMADSDGDGYANLEEYVNSTDPRGGALPVVFVSASDSRAYREDGDRAEFRVWRNGRTDADLEVGLTVGGSARAGEDFEALPASVVIPRGARYVHLAVRPLPGRSTTPDRLVVLAVAPSRQYRLGCPNAALVAIVPGRSPRPVRLADLEPDGGATDEDRAWAARVNQQHVIDRKNKIQERQRKLADPSYRPKTPR